VPRMVSYDPGGMGYSPKAARARRDLRSLRRDPNIANFVLHSASPRADLAGARLSRRFKF
jgi:hypothetical protein